MLRWSGFQADPLNPLENENENESREAVNISPAIALNFLALFVSLFLKFTSGDSPHVFASVTNTCFLVSAFYIHLRATRDLDGDEKSKRTGYSPIKDSYLISNLSSCACIFLILLGASSLAFHSESVLFQPVHAFDILFGWTLVLALAFASVSVSFYAWAGRRLTRQLHSAVFVGFLASIVAVIVNYQSIYTNQLSFYIPCASVSVFACVVARVILVGKRPTLSTVLYASGEIVILILVAAAAVVCQGELVGKQLSHTSNDASEARDYDLFHGIWHYLLSNVASIIFVRCLSVARMIELDLEICVCKPSLLDIFGIISLFFLSVTCLVLKEFVTIGTDNNNTPFIIVACAALPLLVHACVLLFSSLA